MKKFNGSVIFIYKKENYNLVRGTIDFKLNELLIKEKLPNGTFFGNSYVMYPNNTIVVSCIINKFTYYPLWKEIVFFIKNNLNDLDKIGLFVCEIDNEGFMWY
jgi:hypothetical protein